MSLSCLSIRLNYCWYFNPWVKSVVIREKLKTPSINYNFFYVIWKLFKENNFYVYRQRMLNKLLNVKIITNNCKFINYWIKHSNCFKSIVFECATVNLKTHVCASMSNFQGSHKHEVHVQWFNNKCSLMFTANWFVVRAE